MEDGGVAEALHDVDARPGEDRHRLLRAGEEPEYLEASLVPLDAVHLLALAVVLALQADRLAAQAEGGNLDLGESESQHLLLAEGGQQDQQEPGGSHCVMCRPQRQQRD